ncbi:MAG: hypothetical protein KJ593_08080 [Candidatus Omnitrophica bacterium]|nr:hypothetical protein [Candidatus Omnitrophota bacterium]
MIYYSISALINAILIAVVGFYVFNKDRKNILYKRFLLFCISVAIWCYTYFLWLLADDKSTALLYARSLFIGCSFIYSTYFHYITTFLGLNKQKRKFIFYAYLSSFILLASVFTPLFISSVDKRLVFKYWPLPGIAFHLFTGIFFFYILSSIYLLFKTYRHSSGVKYTQLKYILFATIIGFGGGSTNFFLFYNIPIPPIGNGFVSIYPMVMAYAIAKHQFMDIKVAIKKSLVYSTLLALITAIYLVLVLFIEKLFRGLLGYTSIINIFAIFLIAFFFAPLKNRVQYLIDKRFFKGTLSSLAEERERLEEELKRSERLKAVATLAAGMAHEIKNPLTSIKTFTEYLEKNKDKSEFIAKFRKIVGAEVDKIDNIVQQLLDFAKPAPPKLRKCDIQQLLDEILILLSNALLKHKIKLAKEYKTQDPQIQVDSNQLKQAFLNIILNAIEAMPNGGILTVTTKQQNSELIVAIKDTGKGISKESLPHIFDPFYTTSDKGTGLGLSITHGIITEHGGRLEIKSKVGMGSKVEVKLKI